MYYHVSMNPVVQPSTRKSLGFTLVELSIVLVIMALIMGAGMALLNAQIDSQRQASTRVKQDAIRSALTTYISRNSRLPCPADPTLAAGVANYGVEAATPGTCSGITSNGVAPSTVVTGIIPWVSLGISDDAATDGYFNRFAYQVVALATNLNTQTISGMRGYITLHSNGPGTLGAPPAGNQINDCSNGLTFNPCAAVVVVLSHGKNGFGAYSIGGGQVPTAGAGPDELANTDHDSKFVRKDFSDAVGNPFDDVLLALTPSDLLTPLTQSGAVKDYRATLNASFDVFRGAIAAYAISHRTGPGPTAYQYQLPSPLLLTVPASAATDPWGNPITYTVVTPTIAASTTSTLAGYTLSSNGPDGTASTSDDFSTTVSVAELQNTFSKVGF
jgi:prepilin-type N-terminal cleavage/methylation domain-containing protein